MDRDHQKLQEKRRKIAEVAQGQLHFLHELLEKADRLSKIEPQIERCLHYLSELTELTKKLTAIGQEGITTEAELWLENFREEAEAVIACAERHVEERKQSKDYTRLSEERESRSSKKSSVKASSNKSQRLARIQAEKELEMARLKQKAAESKAAQEKYQLRMEELEAESKLKELDAISEGSESFVEENDSVAESARKTKEWVNKIQESDLQNPVENLSLFGDWSLDQTPLPSSFAQFRGNIEREGTNWPDEQSANGDRSGELEANLPSAREKLRNNELPTVEPERTCLGDLNPFNCPEEFPRTRYSIPQRWNPGNCPGDQISQQLEEQAITSDQTVERQNDPKIAQKDPSSGENEQRRGYELTRRTNFGQVNCPVLPRNEQAGQYYDQALPRSFTLGQVNRQALPNSRPKAPTELPRNAQIGQNVSRELPRSAIIGQDRPHQMPSERQPDFRNRHELPSDVHFEPNWQRKYIPRQEYDQLVQQKNSFEKFLPQWKLSVFDGNPMDWPEWQGMFTSTVLYAPISDQEKMTHLKTLLTGKAKTAISRFGFNGAMFKKAWDTLEEKFGQPSTIVEAHFQKIVDFPPVKMHSSEQLVEYSNEVSSLVAVLENLQFDHDIMSCANVRLVLGKLPPNLKERWFSLISKMQGRSVNLLVFQKWLEDIASGHELYLNNDKPARSNQKTEKTKVVNLAASSSGNEKSAQNCPECKEAHQLWKCPNFKEKTATERAKFAKVKKICYSCLDGEHLARQCTKKLKCREKGCKSSHNTLLHGAEKMTNAHPEKVNSSNEPPVLSANEVFKSKLPRGILQVIKLTVSHGDKAVETYALCDTGSTLSWISPKLKGHLNLAGNSTTISIQGFTGLQDLKTSVHTVNISSGNSPAKTPIDVLVKPEFRIGSDKLNVTELKRQCPNLAPLDDETIDLGKVQILLGQSAFKLIRPLEYRYIDEDKPWAVKLPLGWALSGPLPHTIREAQSLPEYLINCPVVKLPSREKEFPSGAKNCPEQFSSKENNYAALQLPSQEDNYPAVQLQKRELNCPAVKMPSEALQFPSGFSNSPVEILPSESAQLPSGAMQLPSNNTDYPVFFASELGNFPSELLLNETINEEDKLAAQLKHWWDMESYGSKVDVKPRSREDKRSMEILEKTTCHNGERYVVGMLWRDGRPKLPNNFVSAKCQLHSLEKRLDKDEALRERYAETIKVDLDKGYVRKVPPEELEATKDCVQWYLPHHPVVNPNKPGKVRRVCNAAAKYKGTSLNDALMTGPDLLNNLVGIILRFRSNPVVLLADVEAMFLQIATPEDDQRTTRFLWREGPSKDIEVYQYLVRIFGGKDSPTCANYALKRTGIDHREEFPEASETVRKDFYMDDLAKAVISSEVAIKLYYDLKKLLRIGGFNLTKWFSNDPTVLERIKREGEVLAIKEKAPTVMTILGLQWNAEKDILSVARGIEPKLGEITQRGILSAISRVYDPLGILAPFMVKARLLLKSVWQEMGQKWDGNVNEDKGLEFLSWIEELKLANSINLDRLFFNTKLTTVELHVFADASEKAMCAVLYFRGKEEDGSVNLSFVMGKIRVAPIRHQTIPKLELQAAIIAVRIAQQCSKELEFQIAQTVYWSDSSTVLQWIHNSEKKQPTFVTNRVQEILDSTSVDQWQYVPGVLNPADHGTRGMSPDEIKSSNWLNGPAFLLEPEDSWPIAPFAQAIAQPDEEQALLSVGNSDTFLDWNKYSHFNKYVRIIAYILRIHQTIAQKLPSGKGIAQTEEIAQPDRIDQAKITQPIEYIQAPPIPQAMPIAQRKRAAKLKEFPQKSAIAQTKLPRQLTAEELLEAKKKVWLIIQTESFPQEIRDLKLGRDIAIKSPIKPLMPFLGENGLLRAGGRLRNCEQLPDSSKFPIILSANHRAVKLYLELVHQQNHHQGVEYLRSVVQQEFWVIKLRNALRAIKSICLVCKKRIAQNYQSPMADLPSERVNARQFAFAQVGVDFFGPFHVKFARKTLKRYGCLFTCLNTRAVHIEVCHSLETDSCIQAIQRFIARRGKPHMFLSDNGTNFVGAVKGLADCMKTWEREEFTGKLAAMEIAWKFNPPGAPHFGGVWERMVQSCKRVIYAILSGRRLTEEVLQTVMCLTEQTLNTRPLTAVSADLEDMTALTPNHFLLGRPSHNLPLCWTQAEDVNLRKAFKRAEAYSQLIWNRWHKEFLPMLTTRTKWLGQEKRPLRAGELVWMIDSTLPRAVYPLARVLEVHKAQDNQVRSAKVKTQFGTYTRPVVKLIPLELESECVPNGNVDRAGDVGD